MKKILVFLFLIMGSVVTALENSSQKKAELKLTVDNVISANNQLEKIFEKYSMQTVNTNVNFSRKICEYELYVNEKKLAESLAEIEKTGIIDFKEILSTNYNQKMESLNYDISYLESQKQIYNSELKNLNKNEKNYNEVFQKERDFDRQIYEKTKSKNEIQLLQDISTIKVTISERKIQDLDDDEFSGFINMPGIETTFFHLENNDDPLLSGNYAGGSLRYMFTRGRCYLLIGILKSLEEDNDSDKISDIVTYAFGKDFYPRYFGRGRNKFFNPYSGFEIGGMIFTSQEDISHTFTIEPHIGIEFFKNKYVIIDSRAGYIFPLDKDFIKSRRGFTANLSINFVF